MMAWIAAHGRALSDACRRLVDHPVAALLNILTMTAALTLPTFAYVSLENIRVAAGRLDTAPQMSVFLAPGLGATDRARIEQGVKTLSPVRSLRFIDRDRALEELKQASGARDLLAGLAGNPLPDGYLIDLTTRDPVALETVRQRIALLPGVHAVEVDSAWAERVDGLVRVAERFTLVVAILLSFAALTSMMNTIRLQVLTRVEEIEVATLFGATAAYLRRPFLYSGVIQAGVGAGLAWIIVEGAASLLAHTLDPVMTSFGVAALARGLIWQDGISLLGFGAFLGWLGALLSVLRRPRSDPA